MSREQLMPEPKSLIENDENHKLTINEESLQILTNMKEPVVVVAIVGKYRTGKSYLMNNLAGYKKGFSLGSTIQSKTKGIWMWCVPHPTKPGHNLVLLDTEGLGDVEKGDSKNDAWIFCLAVLLSSNFVFNSVGTIDQQAMEQLQYVSELTKRIRAKSSQMKDADESTAFKRVFPSFTWCIRDFSLELEFDGKQITEDEYLMISLKCKPENSDDDIKNKQAKEFNLPRVCLMKYFHSHKCFVFERPANSKKLKCLEDLEDGDLDEDFVKQTKEFSNYVFKNGSVKTLSDGVVVTGRMLGNLAVSYLKAIQSGSVPCMENAVLALAEIENAGAVNDAITKYEAEMNEHVKTFPTDTQKEFFCFHEECEKNALGVFMERRFNDKDQRHQRKLKEKLDNAKEHFSRMNEKSSEDFCKDLLKTLGRTLENNISASSYSMPGGHKLFLEEKLRIMEAYNTAPGKGLKALEVQQGFLIGLKEVETAILSADNLLTDKEKEIAAKQAEKEAAEKEKQIVEENARKLVESLEEQRKSHEQHIAKLMEKMEEERKKMKEENDRLIAMKNEEIQNLKMIGYGKRIEELQREVMLLKQRKPTSCVIN
ncbi:guanylate-binding protein 1-like [Pelobates fuscus]|uniref:guanylate-binding protein 1-like n=1 Tax=Pelobates fuscus TaxID=191477 RepID=UPI002FE4ACD6